MAIIIWEEEKHSMCLEFGIKDESIWKEAEFVKWTHIEVSSQYPLEATVA